MIVAFAAILAVLGFRQGFVIGALSFAGFALGAFLGTRLGPLLLPRGSSSPYAPAFGLFGALVIGAVFARGFEGVALRIRNAMVLPGLGALDGALGAVLGAALALGIAWIAAALAAQTSGAGQLRADIQQSAILRRLNELLPPTGGLLNALARLDALPSITGPNADVSAPTRVVLRAPGVRTAAGSVVRVLGSACGLAVEGSGWVAAPDLVVTNAHVVAGEQDTRVEGASSSGSLGAAVVVFDAHDDVAMLSVPGLGEAPLRLAREPASGAAGAILGYPENGPFDAEPARIGRTQTIETQDAYGRGPVQRLLTPLRGLVRPGNSGGPLVDTGGSVLTTVFAGTVGGRERGGYGVANQTVAGLLGTARSRAASGLQASTGPCTSG
jgi:S1-C subfamily serine protease